jgi:TolA-binding protein
MAFEYLETIETDIFRKSQYTFNRATIAHRNLDYQLADSLVTVVIQDSLLNLPQNKWRSGVGYSARKLKSELTLSFTHDPAQAIDWLTQAREFTRSNVHIAEIQVETARLNILNEDLEAAKTILNQMQDNNFAEEKEHYLFLIALFENNIELADSLMNEQIIHRPEGKYTNDAIYLMMHLLNLSEASKSHFLASYRTYLLQDHHAIDMLSEIFAEDEEEELMILALQWALEFDLKDKALVILAHDWQDPVAREYSALLALLLEKSSSEQQRQAREFLKEYPNSVFSPEFRSILSSRPL